MPDITQAGRLLGITSPLGQDTLILRRLTVLEALGRPFVIEAEVASADGTLKPKDLLGKMIGCTIAAPGQPKRLFHAMVRSFARVGGHARDLTVYRLEAVPPLWNLTRTMDCRIFQDKSVKDIAQTLLEEAGVAPVEFRSLPATARPYCVQFNETDFSFLGRLLDEVGGGYFFQQAEADCTLVLTGSNADFPTARGEALVVRALADRPDSVTNWRVQGTLQPGKHQSNDYDMLKPSQPGESTAPTLLETPNAGDWEMFSWAAGQTVRPEGPPAKLLMEQDEAQADQAQGDTQCAALFAGGRVKVREGLEGTEANWLITALRHDAVDETQLVSGADATYANSFVAIPADRVWRNPNARPRPMIPALQAAVVTGPSGEDIHCDKYGRVKVHFLWDRAGATDETSSCYVRVAQPWAGKWGGAWFLPRIGDEVLVGFLEGDVDRPVVIGSLYNDEAMQNADVPGALPGNMTRSGFTSRSSKGGGAATANQFRFEDKKDAEEVFLQAERDLNVVVEKQLSTTVGGDEIRKVEGTHKDQDTGHRTTTIKGNETLTVTEGNVATTIDQGDETRTITNGQRTTEIKGNETLTISSGDRKTTIDSGKDTLTVSKGDLEITVSMGKITIKAAASTVTIDGALGVTLKSGPSSIKVEPAGITLKALKISTAADLLHENKGVIKKHTGDGMLKMGGAITMIG